MLRWILAIGLVAGLAGWLGYGIHAAAIESAAKFLFTTAVISLLLMVAIRVISGRPAA